MYLIPLLEISILIPGNWLSLSMPEKASFARKQPKINLIIEHPYGRLYSNDFYCQAYGAGKNIF
jgi:hypothetical protein